MKRTTLAGLVLGGTIALAYSAGPLYNAITPVDPFVPAPGTTFDAYQIELENSPSPIVLESEPAASPSAVNPQPSPNPGPTESRAPKPKATTDGWIEIKPNPTNPEHGEGRYVGPTRSARP
jgi:hypothetical protein